MACDNLRLLCIFLDIFKIQMFVNIHKKIKRLSTDVNGVCYQNTRNKALLKNKIILAVRSAPDFRLGEFSAFAFYGIKNCGNVCYLTKV